MPGRSIPSSSIRSISRDSSNLLVSRLEGIKSSHDDFVVMRTAISNLKMRRILIETGIFNVIVFLDAF